MTRAVGAIILAAGEGARFGVPKGLARQGDRTWLGLAIEKIQESGIRWISVVLGSQAEEVKRQALLAPADSTAAVPSRPGGLSWVVNHRWREGRSGSIVCGLSDLPPDCGGALLYPVDFPLVGIATLVALSEAFRRDPGGEACIFLPTEGDRRGHPILVGRLVWPEIRALGPDDPMNEVVRRDPARVREVPVEDPGIHRNLNTAAEAEGI